jgi:outer membrane protein assembly factor BamB
VVVAACSSGDNDDSTAGSETTGPATPATTEAPAPDDTEPVTSEPEATDDGRPTQDLWVLHELQTVAADGSVADVLDGVRELAATGSGEPIELTGGATFTPSDAMGAHLRTMDGEQRDGVSVIGGLLRRDDIELAAVLATPEDSGRWPGADDLVSFNVPSTDEAVPLVATVELVQLLPAPVGDESETAQSDLDLMAARIAAGTYQFAATSDGEPLVYVGQVGTTFATTGPSGLRSPAHSLTRSSTRSQQATVLPAGGVPAKARPLIDGIGDGIGGCKALGLKCVKEVLDSIADGASGSMKLLDDNFPPPPPPQPQPKPRPKNYCKPTCASGSGEPHLITFDGLQYDVQLVGEFVAARSDDVEVQIRTAAYGGSRRVSAIERAAVGLDGHVVEVAASAEGDVLVDGEPAPLDTAIGSGALVGDDIVLVRTPTGVEVLRGTDLVLQVENHTSHLSVSVPGGEVGTDWEGLFGDNDGDPTNDLRSRAGDVVENEDVDDFYALHGDTWRLTDDESLFTYADGDSTDTFTDLTFPDEPVRATSLTAQERAQAETVCELAGITEPAGLAACILDFAITGEISMVHAAQGQRALLLALEMTDPGDLDEAMQRSSGQISALFPGEDIVTLRGNGPAVDDGLVLVRTEDADGRMQLRAVDTASGDARWQVPDVARSCRPVVVPGIGVVAQLTLPDADVDHPLVLLSSADGTELARFGPDDVSLLECPQSLRVAGDTVLYLDNDTLYALDASDGLTPRWSREFERPIAAQGVAGQIAVAVRPTDNTTELVLLDAATGEVLANQALSGARYQPAPGVLRDLGDGLVAVLTSTHSEEPGALSVLEISEAQITLRWELVVDETSPYQQPFLQVARAGDVIAAFTTVDGTASVVGFDLATGEERWRYATSSFDNSAGQIEPIGERGFAVTPFGGDWLEVVGVDGEAIASIDPPRETMVSPRITAFGDGQLAVAGRVEGEETGAYVTIVDVP